MEVISDKQLVECTLSGNKESFEMLFERYRDAILLMLHQRSRDVALCDDILQEAFIKAYLNLEKFDSSYNFGGWITRIAKNLLIDHGRRVENRPKEDSCTIEILSQAMNPEEKFMSVEANKRLNDALSSLTPSYRKIIEMRFWRDMSYEQISEELNLPMGTVKTQVHRARRAFIDILGQ